MELLCPAGSFPALKAAVNNGADAVYMGFKGNTNARRFAGLNFSESEFEMAVKFCHKSNVKVHVAINTFPGINQWNEWKKAIDNSVSMGVDVLILADISLLRYVATVYPQMEIHLSVQASATNVESIRFYKKSYGVKRVVLPRVLSIEQVINICRNTDVDIEVFGFGSLCIMSEGRCYLSSYLTSESPNNSGACSPAAYVEWEESDSILESRLNGVVIDRYGHNEKAGYPTLCKGRFTVDENTYHVLEEPVSLNTLSLLPELFREGVSSIKIEGRQRSPAYVSQVTRVWRQAIDSVIKNTDSFKVEKNWYESLSQVSEGQQTTLGAYDRRWR